MIPEEKKPCVSKALQDVFDTDTYSSIEQLTRGLSGSLVYKIVVAGIPYVLRVITATGARDNPAKYFGCMQAAADAGIAPKIWYLSTADRISITDFITPEIFPVAGALVTIPSTLRRLHALPAFPASVNYVDAAGMYIQKMRETGIAADAGFKFVFESFARIMDVYPRTDAQNRVSCHNDLKADNIIFDGVRPWLVDWEAAFLNDRYADLAAIGNFLIKNKSDEAVFLDRYFGEPAGEYRQARFFLMSNIIHMFCFALCAMPATAGKYINMHKNHPGFNDFHTGLWNGTINLANPDEKIQYALVHLEKLQHNIESAAFTDSLAVMAEHGN